MARQGGRKAHTEQKENERSMASEEGGRLGQQTVSSNACEWVLNNYRRVELHSDKAAMR